MLGTWEMFPPHGFPNEDVNPMKARIPRGEETSFMEDMFFLQDRNDLVFLVISLDFG